MVNVDGRLGVIGELPLDGLLVVGWEILVSFC